VLTPVCGRDAVRFGFPQCRSALPAGQNDHLFEYRIPAEFWPGNCQLAAKIASAKIDQRD
jgi:hypothetical protein